MGVASERGRNFVACMYAKIVVANVRLKKGLQSLLVTNIFKRVTLVIIAAFFIIQNMHGLVSRGTFFYARKN